jgi:leucyl/phenylalanyl-tRNA---protein transferase
MANLTWLDERTGFPPLDTALREPNGLLAAGGDLSPARILEAYQRGIFPWFAPGDPILWWSPDPRMVLIPSEFRAHRSLRKTLRHADYTVRFDTAFTHVIRACAATARRGQNGTWISDEMIEAYTELHRMGYAHSVETWRGGVLIGGLYGISIGQAFFGESMFAHATDASKIALAHLVAHLTERARQSGCDARRSDTSDSDVSLIDCQMETSHLATLGARPMPRHEFAARLAQASAITSPHTAPRNWCDITIERLYWFA